MKDVVHNAVSCYVTYSCKLSRLPKSDPFIYMKEIYHAREGPGKNVYT